MKEIILFPDNDKRLWMPVEKTLKQRGASKEMSDYICKRMKSYLDRYKEHITDTIKLELPEGLSDSAIENFTSSLQDAANQRTKNLRDLVLKAMLDISILEIELYECKHRGIKRVK